MIRVAVYLSAASLACAGCAKGTVSNDDGVSRAAAERVVEQFLQAIHEGRQPAACSQLPGQQRGGLARLSASRGGPATCAGALRTLREFALVRRRGPLSIGHRMGFRGSLPHKAREAVDDVSIGGADLGVLGLHRTGEVWRIAIVCRCP